MKTPNIADADATPLDEAARAAWLYYVAGKTQDQIAKELGISRQRAQRLVSKAVAEGLIHVRLEHKVSRCLELETALSRRFSLKLSRVSLSLGAGGDPVQSIASTVAAELERLLSSREPVVLALGTGRSLRASIEELKHMECAQHRIVSLNGNIAPDGSASYFDVIMRIADKVRAPHFPMPLPVVSASSEERELFHTLAPVRKARDLARKANVTFVGIGQMSDTAPLLKDGFLTATELREMQEGGAVGEIAGWAYDHHGRYLEIGHNLRVAGVRVEPQVDSLIVAAAAGTEKVPAILAALSGKLINGLITDEATASELLS